MQLIYNLTGFNGGRSMGNGHWSDPIYAWNFREEAEGNRNGIMV